MNELNKYFNFLQNFHLQMVLLFFIFIIDFFSEFKMINLKFNKKIFDLDQVGVESLPQD